MLPNVTAYHKPASVQEAVRLLEGRRPRRVGALLAGGTALLSRRDPRVDTVIDLGGLGLDYIRQGADWLEIGAMATLQSVLVSPLVAAFARGLLATAAHDTATRTIRNAATVGGSIAACTPANDLVVALLALDASLVTASGDSLPLADVLAQQTQQHAVDFIVEARLPLAVAGWGAAICRVARLPSDQAIVNVAAALRVENGVCRDLRLAAGGVADKPLRLHLAERHLRGTRVAEVDVQTAVDAQMQEVSPPSDILGSSEYRRAMLGVLLRRAVEQFQAKESEK